jgi:hypothetical protein
VREQVGGGHRDLHAGLVERPAEVRLDALALGVVGFGREQVVVVEADPVRAQLGQLAHGVGRVQARPRLHAERVIPLVAHRPEPEGELVLRRGR